MQHRDYRSLKVFVSIRKEEFINYKEIVPELAHDLGLERALDMDVFQYVVHL